MKNSNGNVLVIVLVTIALIGAVFYILSFGKNNSANPSVSPPSENSGAGKQEAENTDTSLFDQKYVAYSEGTLENYSGKRRVLFFYANWCPTCKPVNEELSARESELPEDVVVIRVNYNDSETDASEKELAQKYGVTYQHTFVEVDENGNEVQKWNGGSLEELLERV